MKRYLLLLVSVAWVVQCQVDGGWGRPVPLSWRPQATCRAGDQVPVAHQRFTDFRRRGGYRPPGIDRR